MSYQEYKDFILELYKKTAEELQVQAEELESFYVELSQLKDSSDCLGRLREINTKFKLGIELKDQDSYNQVMNALKRKWAVVKKDLLTDKEVILSIENDFKSAVVLPLFLINLLLNNFEGNERHVATIFIKLLKLKGEKADPLELQKILGDGKAKNIPEVEYSDEIEATLYKIYEGRLMDHFKQGIFEYFHLWFTDYNFAQSMTEKGINKDDIIKKLYVLNDNVLLNLYGKRIRIPKGLSNRLRVGVNILLQDAIKGAQDMGEDIARLDFVWNNERERLRFIDYLNKKYDFNFKMYGKKESIVKSLDNLLLQASMDRASLNLLFNGLSATGINQATGSFPQLIFAMTKNEHYMYWQYVILTGIRLNGISVKMTNNKGEEILHNLEKQMALLIQEDYTILNKDKTKFKRLYRKYINEYVSLIVNFVKREYDIEKLKANVIECMDEYVDNSRDFIDKNQGPRSIIEEDTPKKSDPLEEYIVNGRVVKVCDLDDFKKLLSESCYPDYLQEEFIKQMINLRNRIEQEKYQKAIEESLCGELDEADIRLITEARKSGNVEALDVVNDIDATLDLFIGTSDKTERDELAVNLLEYVSLLRKILYPNKNIVKSGCRIVYFKSGDIALYRSISDMPKREYNNFYDLIEGITDGDRELQANDLPVKIRYKGKKFKIFYTIIGDTLFVIGGGFGKDGEAKVKQLVNSSLFINMLNELNNVVLNNEDINEEWYTEMVMAKLENVKGSVPKVNATFRS